MSASLPGNAAQRQALSTILNFYAKDARVRAVLLFGSLSRGDWDAYSDLDLDIVISDDVMLDVAAELARLCTVFKRDYGLKALIFPAGDEGDVVLSNLLQFSIRYHVLSDTKAAILESMRLLAGMLSKEQIRAAGETNRSLDPLDLIGVVDQCIRHSLELHNAIARQRLWMALELLHRVWLLLMKLFTIAHEGERPIRFFEAQASPDLQDRLRRITPPPKMAAINGAYAELLALLAHDLDAFSNGKIRLTNPQRAILQRLNAA